MGRRISPEAGKAVAALFESEASSLYGYACTLPGVRPADAEDLVQVTFHDAAVKWESLLVTFDHESRRKWLYRVLCNKAIDEWRKYGSRRVSLEQLEDRGGRPDETYAKALFSISLKRCWEYIVTMPETRQRVAFLAWSEGWSAAQIAEFLGIKPVTVRGHLKHARDELATVIGPQALFASPADDPDEGVAS